MKAPFFTDEELKVSLIAGAPWTRARDLPDIVCWADVATFPEEALPVLRDRLDAFPDPAATQQFPIPKEGSEEHRAVTIADLYDEAIYRTVTGRVVSAVDLALGDEIKSYRLLEPPPGWRLRPYRYGADERRTDGCKFIMSDVFGAFGVMDVRHYFPSIDIDRLAVVLENLDALTSDVDALAAYLRSWAELWGVSGLPIGFESSGVLGNAMLVPLDSALRSAGIAFVRYTDDLHLYLEHPSAWARAHDLVYRVLTDLDLKINDQKTRCILSRASALQAAGDDPVLDAVAAGLKHRDPSALSQLKVVFDHEAAAREKSGRRLRFALGVFERHGDDHALQTLVDFPDLFRLAPHRWGSYLVRMRRDGKCNQDWLVEAACSDTTKASACLQFHALRALGAAGHVAKGRG